ncbi:MAG: NAD(+) synthase [Firmicutes bacterium]|nr:NAD(+) synthase [Bacillota bacterium]
MQTKIFDKYVRAAAATPVIQVANCSYNVKNICGLIEKAQEQKMHLLCLPELCITGSTCGDLFLQPTLINSAKEALAVLVDFCKGKDVIVAVGLPLEYDGKLYNVAAIILDGQILGFVPKSCISQHFSSLSHTKTVNWHGMEIPFGTDILFTCKNMPDFTFAVEIGTDLLAPIPPGTRHAMAGAAIILNLAATHEFVGKPAFRRSVVSSQSLRQTCGYVYANAGHGESTTDLVFGGHNVIAENGQILQESPPFGDGWAVSEIDLELLAYDRKELPVSGTAQPSHLCVTFLADIGCENLTRKINPLPFVRDAEGAEEALTIQAAALAKRISHTNGAAVIGISGGLDSCLALLVTVRAYAFLGKPVSEITAVTMPGFGTTTHTKSNSLRLCKALGIRCREIDIRASVALHLEDINHPQGVYDIVFENAQARMRTYVLMDLANQVNGFVIGTGSLSELALGWATYNGDHMSMYAVNAGVPKTLVRCLVEHAAENSQCEELKTVLNSILATKVSPELLPAENDQITQITEDLVGPYELHDFFIYHLLRWGRGPKSIFNLAKLAFDGKYAPPEISHWQKIFYRRFFSQQFKRNCLPDGPQVVDISLSPRAGLQMPSDACVDAWLNEAEI